MGFRWSEAIRVGGRLYQRIGNRFLTNIKAVGVVDEMPKNLLVASRLL